MMFYVGVFGSLLVFMCSGDGGGALRVGGVGRKAEVELACSVIALHIGHYCY